MSRTIAPQLKIAWDGTNFVDETANLISATGAMKMTPPGTSIISPQGTVDRMSVTLYNRTETGTGKRYSPLNSSSPIYSYIQNGGAYHKPVTFDVSINGSPFKRVFTGVIKIPQEGVPTPKQEATVTIECRSVDELLLQLKVSTSGISIKNYADNPPTEKEIIQDLLELSPEPGLSSSDYSLQSGMYTIPFFWLDDESVLEELWALASACGGRLYADTNGKIVYKNIQEWINQSELGIETFTRGMYKDLKIKYSDDDLYSSATVEASPRYVASLGVMWEPSEKLAVTANGGTSKVTAKLRQPAYFVNEVIFQAISSGGVKITSYVTCSVVIFAQSVELTFTNTHPTIGAQIEGLQILGIPIQGAPTIEETVESSSSFWSSRKGRNKSLRGNNYIQSRAQAKSLARFISDTSENPKLSYTLTSVPGDTDRILGKKIKVHDDISMDAERTAFITAVNWTYSASGFYQTLEALDYYSVLKYAYTDYFRIGSDVPGDGTTTGKRLYY